MQRIRSAVERIVGEEGFTVNSEKTRLTGAGGRQTVTGVVVNQTLGLSRQERRRLRAAWHQLQNRDAAVRAMEERRLNGKLAYLTMLNPKQAAQIQP
jgi:RNA-directed DNA polymerase